MNDRRGISVLDYEPDMAVELEDPTDPEETVQRSLMNKLGMLCTQMEELLNAGDADMTIRQLLDLMDQRGDLLDALQDPEIIQWLQQMRESSRVPYRRYSVG